MRTLIPHPRPSPERRGCAGAWNRGPVYGDVTAQAHVSTRRIAALHPAAGGRWNVEQGPHLWGCDRGIGHERVAAGPMHVSGVRSPEGPLFLPTTRHPSAKADGTCSALRGRIPGTNARLRIGTKEDGP